MKRKLKKKSLAVKVKNSKIYLLLAIFQIKLAAAVGILNPAMFSENHISLIESSFSFNTIDSLTTNTSLIRYETNSSNCVSLYSLILDNSNFSLNSLETKHKYFQCQEILELFCNQFISNRTIVSHSIMDCEDSLKMSNKTQPLTASADVTASKIINLSPSSSQIAASIYAIMLTFNVTEYAIVYSDILSSYYSQMASNLVYKLNQFEQNLNLEFSLSLYDPNLNGSLNYSFNDDEISSN